MPDPKLILDFDGVFADFCGGACVVHSHPTFRVTDWDFFKHWGISGEEFWEPIRKKGDCFYEHIVQPYPWARELLAVCLEFDPNLVFASVAGGGHPADYSGKVFFVKKHFGGIPIVVLPPGYKHLLCYLGSVLIDDSDQEIAAWRKRGGSAITFPQPWNAAKGLTDDRVRSTRFELERMMR